MRNILSSKFLEKTIRRFVALPDFFFKILFELVYPIYKIFHVNRAWGRVREHLKKSGFPHSSEHVKNVFKNLFFDMIAALRVLTKAPNAPKIIFENDEILRKVLEKKIPFMTIGVHQGAFEILPRLLAEKYGVQVHLFTTPILNENFTTALRNIRHSERLFEHNTSELPKIFRLFLKEKSNISLAVDQSKGEKGNKITLLGRPSLLYLRLPLLALKNGAAVLTFRAFRVSENKYAMRFETLYEPGVEPSRFVENVGKEVESWIKEHPNSWAWNYHRNWVV